MRIVGEIFELTDRWGRAPSGVATPQVSPRAATRSVDSMAAASAVSDPVLVVSVAKRWIRSSVRRNVVRRIAREAWRASGRDRPSVAGVRWLLKLRANPFADHTVDARPGQRTPSLPATHRAVRANLRNDVDRVLSQAWSRQLRNSTAMPAAGPSAGSRPARRAPVDARPDDRR